MINITINERLIQLQSPITIMDAAKEHGIHIPHFCNHPMLEKFGGCRMCLVEVKNVPRLQTSCTLIATDGMDIQTESHAVIKARRSVLEFLLINHPLDCPKCDKAGECKLQDYTVKYGVETSRFREKKRKERESTEDPLIVRNMERCIMCTRCVRMCSGVQCADAISVVGKGGRSFIEPFSGKKYDCEYCGNCITVCPVGSIMSGLHRYSYRPWQVDKEIKTTCHFCGFGCSMVLQTRDEKIVRAIPSRLTKPNSGLLCNRGYFGFGFIEADKRLTKPLIRKNGILTPCSWDEAIEATADGLIKTGKAYGFESIAGIASRRCTIEDNYAFQKLMRAGLKTNNIDSTARLGYAGAYKLLSGILGQSSLSNPASEILNSNAVLVLGSDPTAFSPVMGVFIRRAFKKGSCIITTGYMPGLKNHRTLKIKHHPNDESLILAGLLNGLSGIKKPLRKDPATDALINSMPKPETSPDGLHEALQALISAQSASIVVTPELMARRDSPLPILLTAAIAYLTNAKVYLLSSHPNEAGLISMGCTPDSLPSCLPLDIEENRNIYESHWHKPMPAQKGLSLMEIIQNAGSGSVKAMYVLGENLAQNLPNSNQVNKSLSKLNFLAVQDAFMTETAELAHVVLPASGWAEKDGTYFNFEWRLRPVKKAVKGVGKEDWKIISEIGTLLGLDMDYHSSEDILNEISLLSPIHKGISPETISAGLDMWPYGNSAQASSSLDCGAIMPRASSNKSVNLRISTYHLLFHSGTTSAHSKSLNLLQNEHAAIMNPATARLLGLIDGNPIIVSTMNGRIKAKLTIDTEAQEDTIYLSNNYVGSGVFSLLGYNIEPCTKTPTLKDTEVEVKSA